MSKKAKAGTALKVQKIAALGTLSATLDEELKILPIGNWSAVNPMMGQDGEMFYLTPERAEEIAADAAYKNADILIDYEHQSISTVENGKPVPAAGWIPKDSLFVREDGLYCKPQWTAQARAMIDAGEYRYLSPVFSYDADTGEVLQLISIALTNTPAMDIPDLSPAVQAAFSLGGTMTKPANKPEEQDKPGAAPEKQDAAPDLAALNATIEAQKVEIESLKKTIDAQKTELDGLKAKAAEAEAEAVILEAMSQGKLVESQKAWALELGKANIASLKAFVASAPVIAALSHKAGDQQPEGKDAAALTQQQQAIAQAMGFSDDDFKKGLK